MNEATAVTRDALVLDTAENEHLGKEVSLIESRASSVVIASDSDYGLAGELTKQVKNMQKQVKDYWEPLRASAKKTYDDVLRRKKEMLSPLEIAEEILKGKMSDYVLEKERKRQEQEEVIKNLARAEVERKLDEAIQANAEGDALGAELAMAEAETMDGVTEFGCIQSQAPKADGVSVSKKWVIESIDEAKVPVSLNGAVIRPVDERAVLELIKASKGKIEIPGVKYKESATISIRTN